MTVITARGKSKNEQFNPQFVNRPVWALASNNALGTAQPILSWFDEETHIVPMLTTGPQATHISRGFATEIGSTVGFAGQTSTYTLTSAANPATGYLSINMFHQTVSLANFEAYSTGWADYYNGAVCASIPRFSVPITGEKKWRQTFDLTLYGNRIYKSRQGNVWSGILQADSFALTDVTQAAGVAPWTQEIVKATYNRNNRLLVLFELTAAVAGTGVAGSMIMKAHYLKLRKKIGADTSGAEMRDMMVEALVNADGASYRAVSFTLDGMALADATLTGAQSTASRQSFVAILCNDGTMWIKIDGHNGSYTTIPLFSVDLLENVDTLTAKETVDVRRRYSGGAGASYFYGSANNSTAVNQGGAYLFSDDNTTVSIHQHLYYYIQGMIAFFCPTASAKANVRPAMFSDPSTSANPYSIAPCGGGSFVICQSGQNQDSGVGPTIGRVELDYTDYIDMNHATAGVAPITVTPQWNNGIYPSVSASTLQGGNQVCKVMPKFEWM